MVLDLILTLALTTLLSSFSDIIHACNLVECLRLASLRVSGVEGQAEGELGPVEVSLGKRYSLLGKVDRAVFT